MNYDEASEGEDVLNVGNTSDTASVGDGGGFTKPDNRGENQGETAKKAANFGEMALQKLQRGRGRPRSRTTSVDRAPKAQDIYSLLLEIKDKQKTGQTDIGHLNIKIGDLQNNLDVNLDTLKTKTAELDSHISTLKGEQVRSGKRVDNVENRTNKVECEIQNQNVKLEQVNDRCIDRMAQVEYELAADIETVKNNIEEQMAYERQVQMQLENRFANFVKELESENTKMKEDLKELKIGIDNLKVLNSDSTAAASSFSDSSAPSAHSQHSENDQVDSDIYMFGDVSRSLILDGIRESRQENLYEIVHHCINDMGVPLTLNDIESVSRIGVRENLNRKPRPVKLVLKDQTIRDQIFHFKIRLRHSAVFRAVMIHREERKDVRVRLAKLKQIAFTAKRLGHRVEFNFDIAQIRIDGVMYSTITLDDVPEKFKQDLRHHKNPPVNYRRMTLSQRCHTLSDNVVMVGPSLQKTPYGLGFFSIKCFLSNFYPCSFTFDGQVYSCVEQGYQCIKAKICLDEVAFHDILKSSLAGDMKRIGGNIRTNERWERLKLQVMEDLIFCKFRQNRTLYNCLLNTRPLDLIECSTDEFWGSGCLMKSVALEEGCWPGENYLGIILVRVRTQLVCEMEESKRK